MSITDYVGRRIEIQITAQDRATGEPSIVTGGIVVAAQRGDTVVIADVQISGAEILALFGGTLTEPGTWYVQCNEVTGGITDVVWADTMVIVPSVSIAGATPVEPSPVPSETATITLTAPSSIMSATGTTTALPDAPTAAGTLADLTLTAGVEMTPVDVSGDFTSTVALTYALAPSSAALPTGVSLSSSGVLSGTPAGTTSGVSIVIRATDTADQTVDSAFTLTVEAATAASATIADFSRDAVVFDGDMMSGTNAAGIPVSGTATADDAIEVRAVVSALDQDPVLFDGRTGSETPAQLRALVKANASKLFNRFTKPPMTLAEVQAFRAAYDGPGVLLLESNRLQARNGAVLVLDNMNLGEIGVELRDSSVLFATNLESTRGILARGSSSVFVNGFKSDNQIDKIFNAGLGSVEATVYAFENATVHMSDVCITRNECDTFKLACTGGATIVGCVAEPIQREREATEYDAGTTYAVGDYVTLSSDPEPNVSWRKMTDAAAGTAPPVGNSSGDWKRNAPHYDFCQQFSNPAAEHGPINFVGLYYNDQNTQRLAGDTSSDYTSVVGTAVFFQMASSYGDFSVRGAIINSTQLPWMRRASLPSGTTTVVDAQIADNSVNKVANEGTITAARIVNMAGDPLDVTSGTSITVVDGSAEPATDYTYIAANHDFEYGHDWQTVGTASGGTWSGTITEPVRPLWYRLEARVSGSAEPAARMDTRCGVGIVFYNHRQSNGTFSFGDTRRNIDFDLAGIGDSFQVTRLGDGPGSSVLWGGNPDNRILRGPEAVKIGNWVTAAISGLAESVHKNAPGLKVHALLDFLAGQSTTTTLSTATIRLFSKTQELVDSLEDGQEIGAVIFDHWNGLDDGTVSQAVVNFAERHYAATDPAVDFALTNSFDEAIPGLTTGRTKALIGGNGGLFVTTGDGSFIEKNRQIIAATVAEYPTRTAAMLDYTGIISRFQADNDGAHFSPLTPYGTPLLGAMWGSSLLKNAGVVDAVQPVMDMVEVDPGGAHVTIWSSAGPITTIERQEALAEGRAVVNYPVNPSPEVAFQDLTPGDREVLGVQFGDFSSPTRVEIVDESGNPASAGRIRIYPDSGTFNSTSLLTYGKGSVGASFGGGNSGLSGVEFGRNTQSQRHLPIVDVGLQGRTLEHGVYVAPNLDFGFINTAIESALGSSAYRVTVGADSPGDSIMYHSASLGDSTRGWSVHFKGTVSSGELILMQHPANALFMWFKVGPDSMRLRAQLDVTNLKFDYNLTGLTIPRYADGTTELLLNVDQPAGRIEMYTRTETDGTWAQYDPGGVWFDNSTMTPGGIAVPINVNIAGAKTEGAANATFEFIKCWKGERQGTAHISTTPTREFLASPTGSRDASVLLGTGGSGLYDRRTTGTIDTP